MAHQRTKECDAARHLPQAEVLQILAGDVAVAVGAFCNARTLVQLVLSLPTGALQAQLLGRMPLLMDSRFGAVEDVDLCLTAGDTPNDDDEEEEAPKKKKRRDGKKSVDEEGKHRLHTANALMRLLRRANLEGTALSAPLVPQYLWSAESDGPITQLASCRGFLAAAYDQEDYGNAGLGSRVRFYDPFTPQSSLRTYRLGRSRTYHREEDDGAHEIGCLSHLASGRLATCDQVRQIIVSREHLDDCPSGPRVFCLTDLGEMVGAWVQGCPCGIDSPTALPTFRAQPLFTSRNSMREHEEKEDFAREYLHGRSDRWTRQHVPSFCELDGSATWVDHVDEPPFICLAGVERLKLFVANEIPAKDVQDTALKCVLNVPLPKQKIALVASVDGVVFSMVSAIRDRGNKDEKPFEFSFRSHCVKASHKKGLHFEAPEVPCSKFTIAGDGDEDAARMFARFDAGVDSVVASEQTGDRVVFLLERIRRESCDIYGCYLVTLSLKTIRADGAKDGDDGNDDSASTATISFAAVSVGSCVKLPGIRLMDSFSHSNQCQSLAIRDGLVVVASARATHDIFVVDIDRGVVVRTIKPLEEVPVLRELVGKLLPKKDSVRISACFHGPAHIAVNLSMRPRKQLLDRQMETPQGWQRANMAKMFFFLLDCIGAPPRALPAPTRRALDLSVEEWFELRPKKKKPTAAATTAALSKKRQRGEDGGGHRDPMSAADVSPVASSAPAEKEEEAKEEEEELPPPPPSEATLSSDTQARRVAAALVGAITSSSSADDAATGNSPDAIGEWFMSNNYAARLSSATDAKTYMMMAPDNPMRGDPSSAAAAVGGEGEGGREAEELRRAIQAMMGGGGLGGGGPVNPALAMQHMMNQMMKGMMGGFDHGGEDESDEDDGYDDEDYDEDDGYDDEEQEDDDEEEEEHSVVEDGSD